MLITKMASFFGFGAPGRRRKHFKIGISYFYSLQTERPSCTGLPDQKFREMPAWVAKPQFYHFHMLPTPTRSPKYQKGGHFRDQHQILNKQVSKSIFSEKRDLKRLDGAPLPGTSSCSCHARPVAEKILSSVYKYGVTMLVEDVNLPTVLLKVPLGWRA